LKNDMMFERGGRLRYGGEAQKKSERGHGEDRFHKGYSRTVGFGGVSRATPAGLVHEFAKKGTAGTNAKGVRRLTFVMRIFDSLLQDAAVRR
jgi:hypothetical protein